MVRDRQFFNRLALVLLGSLATSSVLVGCSTLQIDGSITGTTGNQQPLERIAAETPVPPPLELEIRAAGKDPELRRLPLQEGMCIQDALTETGLTKRFRRMDVKLVRTTEEGAAKLDSKYDHKANQVESLYDYALHPGDRLIVIEDTSTMLDDLLNGLPSFGRRKDG